MNFTHQADITVAHMLGASRPITKGGFIVVSKYEKKLHNSPIKYLIVGEEYNRVIDIIRRRYPGVVVVTWDNAPEILCEVASKVTGAKVSGVVLNEENRPYYHIAPKYPFGRHPVEDRNPVLVSEEDWVENPASEVNSVGDNNGPDVW